MSCYTKIKNALEQSSGVRVDKNKEQIIIIKDDILLTTYDLKFVKFSESNTNNFINHWEYKLGIKSKKNKKSVAKGV